MGLSPDTWWIPLRLSVAHIRVDRMRCMDAMHGCDDTTSAKASPLDDGPARKSGFQDGSAPANAKVCASTISQWTRLAGAWFDPSSSTAIHREIQMTLLRLTTLVSLTFCASFPPAQSTAPSELR